MVTSLLHRVPVLALLCALGMGFSACASDDGGGTKSGLVIPAPSSDRAAVIVEQKEVSSSPAISDAPAVAVVPVPSPSPALPPAAVESAPTVASVTVYATKSGSKYHRGTCRHLSKSKIPMTLEEAKRRYGPCSVCKPPS